MDKNIRIGEFIAERLAISKNEFNTLLRDQDRLNEKFGEIALKEKCVNTEELEKILDFHIKKKISVGNAALYLGLLKNSQVKYLLDLQAQSKHRFGELLVAQGIVSQVGLLKILDEFYSQKQNPFTILALIRSSICEEVQKTIRTCHYRFHSCANEEELMSRMEKLDPQLVLLDQEVEKALKCALRIRQASAGAPLKIALFSTGKQKLVMLTGYEYGIDYILPASFHEKHLINIMIDAEFQGGEKRKERILVVDDSPMTRKSIAGELTQEGFQTLFAENGKEAVEIAALEKPDLITMDVNMPVMDGYEACLKLKNREITGRIPVVILTSNNTREEREKGFEAGAVEYFTKPFTRGHLSAYVKHLLSGKKKIRPEKILIAEDSRVCQRIYESIMDKYGFPYKIVGNGQEVLDALEKGYGPSAIILDCYMPIMDGFRTCLSLKRSENYRHIPVIMVTVAKKKDDILAGLKEGANDYIPKPFDADELIARVEAHIKNLSLFEKLQEQNVLLRENGEELKKLTTGLTQANREIKNFADIISHDLRVPLFNIQGFSHELKTAFGEIKTMLAEAAGLLDEDKRKRMEEILRDDILAALDFIDTSTSSMERLIAHILSLSRVGRRPFNPVEINAHELIKDMLKTFQRQVREKGIKITVHGLPAVRADAADLDQIFSNILSNAVSYLVPGRPGIIDISGEIKDNHTLFSVKDNGQGIAGEDHYKVFEIFRRAGKQDVPGEGMGLAYVKTLVERHGGEVCFESEEGKGTTFFFTIPNKA